jgi:hypothetical protein
MAYKLDASRLLTWQAADLKDRKLNFTKEAGECGGRVLFNMQRYRPAQ